MGAAAEQPAQSARFDKLGNRLPETGHGCGCHICADAHAERQERTRPWTRVIRFVKKLIPDTSRPQAA
jgi:hypothetical protein